MENVKDPENHIQAVLDRVKPEHLIQHFNLSKSNNDADIDNGQQLWVNAEDFLRKVAISYGRLLRGGEPDITTVAKMILNDFQRGNLPHFVCPPDSKEPKRSKTEANMPAEEEVLINDSDEVRIETI